MQPCNLSTTNELFNGKFETGVRPDEVNWQQGESDPSLSRQVCNGWKANRDIASIVLDESSGHTAATNGWATQAKLDELFPVLWREDGYRTPQIDDNLEQR